MNSTERCDRSHCCQIAAVKPRSQVIISHRHLTCANTARPEGFEPPTF